MVLQYLKQAGGENEPYADQDAVKGAYTTPYEHSDHYSKFDGVGSLL